MDWSKIKTIFIFSFLILDLYLLYEFVKMLDHREYDVYSEVELATIETRLNDMEIKYGTLPEGYTEDFILIAEPKKFTDKDREILENQTASIIEEIEFESSLDEPLKIPEEFDQEMLNSFIKDHVLYGDQYYFAEKSNDSITYYQYYEGYPLFRNPNGALVFKINDDNEIVSYIQTYFEEIKEFSAPEKVIPPIKAIEVLLTNGDLPKKSEITKVQFGYYTIFTSLDDPLDTPQLLYPAWILEINKKETLLVNAFEGKIIELEEDKD